MKKKITIILNYSLHSLGVTEFYVPYKLAYGSIDDPSKRPAKVGPKAALIFQVELVEVGAADEEPPSEEL